MRLFVAVNLPEGERTRLSQLVARLRKYDAPVRWVEPESLHITLKFLGEVAESAVDDVVQGMRQAVAGVHSFDMHLGSFGAFPTMNRARVFWLGIQAPGLILLQQNVEQFIEPLGFPREKRAFSPHLTLGRVTNNARVSAELADRMAAVAGYKATVHVDSIELMRSHLSPRGARYEVLQSAPMRKRR